MSSDKEPLRTRHRRSASDATAFTRPIVDGPPPQLPPVETEERRRHRQKEIDRLIVNRRMRALSTVYDRKASSPYYLVEEEDALPFELYPILSLTETPVSVEGGTCSSGATV
ncbi:hypothetical protein PUNSTDRAFT_55839 [Punctularia strigosozonata HHB-11173 SS5]|uniref:Uncharacterized protein n=1 Tax=Punctularia strigosozonata (strain HHB-11173) TaxID=741275 RepID=R7S0T0_PUNST|nr:uncharacterized protein PUNSTDRAFT_55839 [Punctularia strigosozonata HHB-11173 SS5]EIN03995.1 hypothetical protein PUNSTDRAFT_55839 [Punctularia strigosozonata HHB-11173 SS5]